MALFARSEHSFVEAISQIAYCNPFLPQRIDLERRALGRDFLETDASWNVRLESGGMHANIVRMMERAKIIANRCRDQVLGELRPSAQELSLYEGVVFFFLYHHYIPRLQHAVGQPPAHGKARKIGFYEEFARDLEHYLGPPGVMEYAPAHLFACFFQLRRAFHHIFNHIFGASGPIIRLRAAVWQSMFTHDMRRYRRVLYDRMGDMTTLVTGDSGTGKELVAKAIGLSRYIPFDASAQQFKEDFSGSFLPINLSALSPTLIESELFGHRRGAFTGAVADRAGWLEVCPPLGTVFLDEVGEIDPVIQVKLLRVLQVRTFQRLGDTETRHFAGKIIAATNRDLGAELDSGRLRRDFYYRLCSDIITTPTLRDQLADAPEELHNLLLFIARRIAGEQEAGPLADEVAGWIDEHLGRDYAWPGNFRELEQCVRNVMIRRTYDVPKSPPRSDNEELVHAIESTSLTADELLRRYCSLAYRKTGSIQETARRLQLDRRTVRSRIDPGLL